MLKNFLVFWYDGNKQHSTILPIVHPPHEPPIGGVLDELIQDGLDNLLAGLADPPLINGAIELVAPIGGGCFALTLGDGRVASLECSAAGEWRVHA